jgi:heme/copper-type cytochrome/quinol oxidase subunit 1
MSTTGHFITIVGVAFFFLMILDSHFEKKLATSASFGIPRWHKRALYYLFKIRYLQTMAKKFARLPTSDTRIHLIENSFNEYEFYEYVVKAKKKKWER